MAKFKFNYKPEKELRVGPNLLKPGPGTFEVKKVFYTDKEGKPLKTGKHEPKVDVMLVVTDADGLQTNIYEGMSINTNWKIHGLCKGVGRKDLYAEDGVDFDVMVGMEGECIIKTKSSPGYNDKSEIGSYVDISKKKEAKEPEEPLIDEAVPF